MTVWRCLGYSCHAGKKPRRVSKAFVRPHSPRDVFPGTGGEAWRALPGTPRRHFCWKRIRTNHFTPCARTDPPNVCSVKQALQQAAGRSFARLRAYVESEGKRERRGKDEAVA